MLAAALLPSLGACTLQLIDGEGGTRTIGTFVETERPLFHGRVRTLLAPGLIIRWRGEDPGLTLGLYVRRGWEPERLGLETAEDREVLSHALDGQMPDPALPRTDRWSFAWSSGGRAGSVVLGSTAQLGLGLNTGRHGHLALGFHRRNCIEPVSIGEHGLLSIVRPGPGKGPSSVLLWTLEPIPEPAEDESTLAPVMP